VYLFIQKDTTKTLLRLGLGGLAHNCFFLEKETKNFLRETLFLFCVKRRWLAYNIAFLVLNN